MQLYAFDNQYTLIQATEAKRQTPYFCLECRGPLRLRAGPKRHPHFFHISPNPTCRQHQKTEEHIALQLHLLHLLPSSHIEHPFPTISRIADLFWPAHNLIFEVQCSPISPQEVLARNRDYASLNLQVIWLLHHRRFVKKYPTSVVTALRSSPHYFFHRTHIFDQYSLHSRKFPINPTKPLPLQKQAHPNALLHHRFRTWPLHFAGDLLCYPHLPLPHNKPSIWQKFLMIARKKLFS